MNMLGLVQLCEVTGPYYSHSLGVEMRRGELGSAEALAHFVREVLVGTIGPAEGVASGAAFRAARVGEVERIPALCQISAERLPAEIRVASVQTGRQLWEVSRRWEWAGAMHQQLDGFAGRVELNHAVAFGALVSEATSSQVRAIAAFLLNVAKGIVAVAVRVVPLDERCGQRVLAEVGPTIAELAAEYAGKGSERLG